MYATKPRPALIIQDDLYASESITVIPLTTVNVDAPLYRVPIKASTTTGIEKDSQVMIDKITTLRRRNVTEFVGRVTASDLVAVERLLLAFLGLAR